MGSGWKDRRQKENENWDRTRSTLCLPSFRAADTFVAVESP